MLEALPYVSWFKDADGNFSMVNAMLLTTYQKGLFEVVGRRNQEVFDPDEARLNEDIDREILETGKITQSTYSRNQRVFKTIHFPVIDDNGGITGTGGFQEDITNLSRSLQELHMEREYLEALLENMPYYIFFTDRHHRYIRINNRMARLLRVSGPEEASGKGNDAFFSRRVARKMLEEDRNIIETGEPMLNRIIFFEDEGVDGFWMEKNKIPIKDERGIVTMIIGIFKDVSGMMKIENELKEARDRAEESDRLKTSFLANMPHEIRTPMNGILGFANLLKDPDLKGDKRDLYVKHIEQSSKQLLNIIDDIIDISKIESGQLKISNRPVRINGIMDEVYSSFFHRIRGDAPGQKRVTFNLEKGVSGANFTLVTDDYRLRQVFNNLIGNAIKFTEDGTITFGYVLKNNRHIEFFVKDSGPGIPENMLDLVFDRFGQVNQESYAQPSGTGLGLPISKNLVKLMGGEMWVESKINKGSIFRFTLPLVVEHAGVEPRVLISNKSYNWTGKIILVAEDEMLNWMFIKMTGRNSAAEIMRAEDGNQAVKIARKFKPDFILMDIKMPGLNGIDATRKIRTFNKTVPIIAQTAFVMAEEKAESKKVGCNHFVTKPLDRTVIMELIDSYFNKKE